MKVSRFIESLQRIATMLEDGNENDRIAYAAGRAYSDLMEMRRDLLRHGLDEDEAPRNLVKVK